MNAPCLRRCLLAAAGFAALPAGAQNLADAGEVVRTAAAGIRADTEAASVGGRSPGAVDGEAFAAEEGTQAVAGGDGAAGVPDTTGFYFTTTTMPARLQAGSVSPANAHLDRSGTTSSSRLIAAGWSDPGGSWWQPQVSCVLQQESASAQSTFGLADALSQDTRSALDAHNVSAEWNLSGWRVGYRLSSSAQRAIESSVAKTAVRGQGRAAYAGMRVTDRLDLQMDLGSDLVRDAQTGVSQTWAAQTISAQWRFDRGFALGSSIYRGRSAGTGTMPAMRTQLVDATLTYTLGRPSAPDADSQAYLRFEQQAVGGDGIVFTTDAPQRSRTVTVGLSFPF
jgi:hypothetical protein